MRLQRISKVFTILTMLCFISVPTISMAADMTVKGGNVGIGTDNPNYLLHVVGERGAIANERTDSNRSVWWVSKPGGVINQTNVQWNVGIPNLSNSYVIRTWDGYTNTDRVAVDTNGNVGIGTNSPAFKLHINGDAAGTSWTNLSSRSFKDNIETVDSSIHTEMLSALMEADITTYSYKEEFDADAIKRVGFIAEDMPKEVLSKNGKGVDIYELLTYTIGAMKAQQKQIEALQKKIDSSQPLTLATSNGM